MIRELQRNRQLGYTPIGLIDDDPRKRNLRVHGVRVLGTTFDLPHILRDNKPDEVLIAIPSAAGDVRQRIVNMTREAGVPVKTLPGLYELISGESDLAAQIRPVEVEDVLGREPVEVDLNASAAYLRDQTVLVTGAGGSIGSELCRQIARLGAAAARAGRAGGDESVRDRARARRRARLRGGGARARRLQEPDEDAPGLRALQAVGRLPRGRVQARRRCWRRTRSRRSATTSSPRGSSPRRRSSSASQRFVLVSTDKAVNPKTVYGPLEGALRVDRRGLRREEGRLDPLRSGPLRQRARLVGQRDPDLPAPDRQGRPADRDPPGHDALLHDDARRRRRS